MPLDKVLYQVAKIEHDSGEPDKIWKITDIDDLIASTDADSTALDYDDDDELLMSIAYYKNRYSDDDISSEYETIYTDPKEPESEPDEEPGGFGRSRNRRACRVRRIRRGGADRRKQRTCKRSVFCEA